MTRSPLPPAPLDLGVSGRRPRRTSTGCRCTPSTCPHPRRRPAAADHPRARVRRAVRGRRRRPGAVRRRLRHARRDPGRLGRGAAAEAAARGRRRAVAPARCCGAGRTACRTPELTQLAIDRRLTLIAFEAMNHWTHDGHLGLHVFHKNNELAGYCSVIHALQLAGLTGDYGRRLSAVVIGFGATARGAVTALNAHGVHEVAVLTNRGVAAVGLPDPLGADPPVRPRAGRRAPQPRDHRARPRAAGGLPRRERHRRQLHPPGPRAAADLPADRGPRRRSGPAA